jgi:glycosyltransferase involved in cell wall biosynthesis
MTPPPEVSVVMCVYNGGATLRATVESVLAQEGVELELVVVDDGSTDETAKGLEEFARGDARVRVHRQDNAGLTVGLIRGCDMARGRYIARQDAGDQSLGGRLRAQKALLDANAELSFVSCWTRVCGPKQEFLTTSRGSGRAAGPIDIIDLGAPYGIIDGPSHHGSVMFRKDRYVAAGGYRAQFYFGQDWDLWYRLGEAGKFQMAGELLYQACVTPQSLSSRYRKEQQEISKLSHRLLLRRRANEGEDDLLELARAIRPTAGKPAPAALLAQGFYFIGEQLRRNGDPRAASYLRDALKASPRMLRAWVRLGQLWLASKR